jgi:hypothetical protein
MKKVRARDLGIPFEGSTGEFNAITDVPGVTVGYSTVIHGERARTGVTIIHPHGADRCCTPVFAGVHSFQWQWRNDRRGLGGRRRVVRRTRGNYEHT